MHRDTSASRLHEPSITPPAVKHKGTCKTIIVCYTQARKQPDTTIENCRGMTNKRQLLQKMGGSNTHARVRAPHQIAMTKTTTTYDNDHGVDGNGDAMKATPVFVAVPVVNAKGDISFETHTVRANITGGSYSLLLDALHRQREVSSPARCAVPKVLSWHYSVH